MAFPAAVARLLGRGATAAERSLGATAGRALRLGARLGGRALGEPVRPRVPARAQPLLPRAARPRVPRALAGARPASAEGRGGRLRRGRRRGDRRAARAFRRAEQRLRLPGAPAGRGPARGPPLDPAARVARERRAARRRRLPRRAGARVAPVACVAVAFVALAGTVSWPDRVSTAEARRLAWVDDALPGSARALLVHVDLPPVEASSCGQRSWFEQQALGVWTEFFNTRVDRVAHVYGQNEAAGIPSPELVVAPSGGVLLTDEGRTLGSALRRPRLAAADRRDPAASLRPRSGSARLPRRRLAVALACRGAAAARSAAVAAAAAGRRLARVGESGKQLAVRRLVAASRCLPAERPPPARGRARPTAPARGARRRPPPRSPPRRSGRTAARRRRRPRRRSRSPRPRPGSRRPSPRAAGSAKPS